MYIVFIKIVECLFYVYRCKFVIVSPLDEHYMLLGQTILFNKYLLNQISGHIHTHLHIKQIEISREQTIKTRN
jgi:hypothetical protein